MLKIRDDVDLKELEKFGFRKYEYTHLLVLRKEEHDFASLDKQVDEYIKSVEKDVSTYYENKERISIMQTLSYFIDTLQELLEGRK